MLAANNGFARSHIFEERTTVVNVDLSTGEDEYIRQGLRTLDQETSKDFQGINAKSYLLKDYLPSSSDYVFLSRDEIQQLSKDNWKGFSAKYPGENGIGYFSRVGFNPNFTQALVLEGYYAPSNGPFSTIGAGFLIILQKANGKWVEREQLVVSITG